MQLEEFGEQESGDHGSLVVAHAAAVGRAVLDLDGEGIVFPVGIDGHHVRVAGHEEHGMAVPHFRDEVGPFGRALVGHVRDLQPVEIFFQNVGHEVFVAGRIDGVLGDQFFQERHAFFLVFLEEALQLKLPVHSFSLLSSLISSAAFCSLARAAIWRSASKLLGLSLVTS